MHLKMPASDSTQATAADDGGAGQNHPRKRASAGPASCRSGNAWLGLCRRVELRLVVVNTERSGPGDGDDRGMLLSVAGVHDQQASQYARETAATAVFTDRVITAGNQH